MYNHDHSSDTDAQGKEYNEELNLSEYGVLPSLPISSDISTPHKTQQTPGNAENGSDKGGVPGKGGPLDKGRKELDDSDRQSPIVESSPMQSAEPEGEESVQGDEAEQDGDDDEQIEMEPGPEEDEEETGNMGGSPENVDFDDEDRSDASDSDSPKHMISVYTPRLLTDLAFSQKENQESQDCRKAKNAGTDGEDPPDALDSDSPKSKKKPRKAKDAGTNGKGPPDASDSDSPKSKKKPRKHPAKPSSNDKCDKKKNLIEGVKGAYRITPVLFSMRQ
ncbi:hypothetical protein DXG01_001439 [Tephrocybe rancida]|nr:hypothetical protein DXG01_001439 [Tephrocybe rancida]